LASEPTEDWKSSVSGRDNLAKLVRLPKIELPIYNFKGDITEWQSFWDKFEALVHSADIPTISKFTYLDSLLEGEAKATIAGLSVTVDHYDDARNLLEDRYGRKERITFAHIQVLLKMSTRSANGKVSQLSKLYDEVQAHVRSLEALDISGDKYGVFLTPVILSCLPKDVRLEWARDGEGHEDDLDYLLTFLKGEIWRRESADCFKELRADERPVVEGAAVVPTIGALHASTSREKCGVCHKIHATAKCWDLTRVSVAERKERIWKKNLCFRCFGSHFARSCAAKCSKCGGGHHQLLCDNSRGRKSDSTTEGNVRTVGNINSSTSSVETVRNSAATASHSLLSNSRVSDSDMRTILPIAKVRVKGENGFTEASLLFDSGSDRSYVSSQLVKRVRPKWAHEEPIQFASFGGGTSGQGKLHNVYALQLSSLMSNDVESISAVEVPVICTPLQRPQIPSRILDAFPGIDFADSLAVSGEGVVDILIGIDNYWDLMRPGLKPIDIRIVPCHKIPYLDVCYLFA
jgi:hypothetical protein